MTMGHRNGCQFCLGLHRACSLPSTLQKGWSESWRLGRAHRLPLGSLTALRAGAARPARRRVSSGLERLSRSRLQSRAGAGRRDWRQRIHADDFGEPTGRSLSHGIRTARPRHTTAANCVCGRALGGVLPTPGVTVDDRCAWRLAHRARSRGGAHSRRRLRRCRGEREHELVALGGLGAARLGRRPADALVEPALGEPRVRRSRRSRPSDVASAASDLPSRSAQRTVGCVDRNTAAASSAGRTSSRTVDRLESNSAVASTRRSRLSSLATTRTRGSR